MLCKTETGRSSKRDLLEVYKSLRTLVLADKIHFWMLYCQVFGQIKCLLFIYFSLSNFLFLTSIDVYSLVESKFK